jgi:hypothetical protein
MCALYYRKCCLDKLLLLLELPLGDFSGEACKKIPSVALNKQLK